MLRWVLVVCLVMPLAGCGSGEFRQLDAERQTAWLALQPLYQLRTALALNVLNSTQSQLAPEVRDRLLRTRHRAQTLPPLPTPDDTALLQAQVVAQSEFAAALAPLLVQARRQAGLLPLVQQLEGLDNRIRVEQQRYVLATNRYNQLRQAFPSSLTAWARGLEPRPVWPPLP